MSKVVKEKPGYAGVFMMRWWLVIYMLIPGAGGALFNATKNEPSGDKINPPMWFGVLGYAVACLIQYLYDNYSPAIRQAMRISRKFVWWRRFTVVLVHGFFLTSFFYGDGKSDGIFLLIIVLIPLSLWPIWDKELTNRIKLH